MGWLKNPIYRSQISTLASTKVCWQLHGQGGLLQPYARDFLWTLLLQLLLQAVPSSNPPDLFASEKKIVNSAPANSKTVDSCHANMTQILAYRNAYLYCFMYCGSFFKFIKSGIWFLYMVSFFLFTQGCHLHSFIPFVATYTAPNFTTQGIWYINSK